MSESIDGGVSPADESSPRESPGVPHRVIGTPPPAQASALLPDSEPGARAPAARELPADPPDPAAAKRAERLVAALFMLSFLAGIGFIVAYLVLPVGSPGNVEHSNMALGGAMACVFLALAVGATIWVRHLMPNVELTEERHPLRSTDEDRAAFAQTFAEGAEASQFTKRPLLRRTLIAASLPAALAPVLLLRDMGPLPGKSLDFTVWRKGLRLITYASNRPLKPADFSSPGSMITVIPEGYQDNFDALAKAAVIIIKFRPGQITYGKPPRPAAPTSRPARSCRTGPWTTSWPTRRSALTSAARRPCTSRPPCTSSARATSPRSTRRAAPR